MIKKRLTDLLNKFHIQKNKIVQLEKENKDLKEENEELREYTLYLRSILEDNEIWYE